MTHPTANHPAVTPTSGPYELLDGTDMIYTVGDPYGHGPMHVADVRGWGHMTGRGGGLAWPEERAIATQEATGKLLAASWDLLEAAQLAVNALSDVESIGWAQAVDPKRWAHDVAELLRAAIAKAGAR